MKLHLVYYKYLSVKSFKKGSTEGNPLINRLTFYTSACCSPVLRLYSKIEVAIIPNRRRLPEDRKN